MNRRRQRPYQYGERLETRNLLASVTFLPHSVEELRAQTATAVDLDVDGWADLVLVNSGVITWHRSVNGGQQFGVERSIGVTDELRIVRAVDIDGDNDSDIIAATISGVVWFENSDGRGTFRQQHTVESGTDIFDIATGDIDGDGDLDVVWSSYHRNPRPPHGVIGWSRNVDGEGSFVEERPIASQVGVVGLSLTDIDQDDDLDLITTRETGLGPGIVTWFEHVGQPADFRSRRVLNEFFGEETRALAAVDVDGDSDTDIVSTATGFEGCNCGALVWHENTGGQGGFQVSTVVESGVSFQATVSPIGIEAVDLDRDGDPDLVVQTNGSDRRVHWYANFNEAGFEHHYLAADQLQAVADFDGDGDLDILTTDGDNGNLTWFENRVVGDSNDDDVFDTSDLVTVFTVGKFENNAGGVATFDEGDWNQDGRFDTADLVFAFQAGHFGNRSSLRATDIAAAMEGIKLHSDKYQAIRRVIADANLSQSASDNDHNVSAASSLTNRSLPNSTGGAQVELSATRYDATS